MEVQPLVISFQFYKGKVKRIMSDENDDSDFKILLHSEAAIVAE